MPGNRDKMEQLSEDERRLLSQGDLGNGGRGGSGREGIAALTEDQKRRILRKNRGKARVRRGSDR